MKIIDIKPESFENAAVMLKAMAHPMRITILNMLNDGKKLTVTEIYNALNIEQSTTSHHLGILKDKGVLRSERKGKYTYYYLKNENLEHIINCISKCSDCDKTEE